MKKFYYDKDTNSILVSEKEINNNQLEELVANTKEAALEKHIPMVKELDNQTEIQVGSVLHPSTEEHYIEWIYVELKNGNLQITFHCDEQPIAIIPYKKEEILAVYSYCNLHGLWKLEDLS